MLLYITSYPAPRFPTSLPKKQHLTPHGSVVKRTWLSVGAWRGKARQTRLGSEGILYPACRKQQSPEQLVCSSSWPQTKWEVWACGNAKVRKKSLREESAIWSGKQTGTSPRRLQREKKGTQQARRTQRRLLFHLP